MPRFRVPRFHVGGRPPGAYPAPVDQFWSIISHPVAIGLALGLLVAAFTWKSGLTARRALRREVARLEQAQAELQGHLNTQLKISATGSRQVLAELEELRRQNENLRVNLAQFQQKPGRAEIRQLHILEAAARRMRERAPGFAPAWEQALREAEEESQQAEGGLRKLVRRVMPAIGMGSAAAEERDAVAEKDA